METAPEFGAEAVYLAQRLRTAAALPLPLTEGISKSTTDSVIQFRLEKDAPKLGREGYRLTVDGNRIELKAAETPGIFYAVQTFLQLLPPAVYSGSPRIKVGWAVPGVRIEDYPRFAWRGAMLDCARHFRPVGFIKRFLDLLAMHKLNVFHWHLTDDQGWRIEIKKYPKLTEVGGWRRETRAGHTHGPGAGDGVPHGGFYTQAEVREIVAYAAERHITVVPEIEMPGHAQAAIAAYPELGCTGEKLEVWTQWGINENIFNPKEETLLFLEDVLG